MAFDQAVAARVRALLVGEGQITERPMFGGLAFMRDGQMYVTVGKNRLMLRVDPDMHDELVHRPGCTTVVMRGRPYRGWVRVTNDVVTTREALATWVALATRYAAPAARSR